nr:hypothetical protein [bacterium]
FGRFFASEDEYFGFGLGEVLKENQKQDSIRMGQRIRYADLFAFPKLAISSTDKTADDKALLDRNYRIITYTNQMPQWMTPPSSNGVVESMIATNNEQSQTNSGMVDFSKTQTSKVLQTATGQTQVVESTERRVNQAREQYGEFLKSTVIKLFKFCQLYWGDDKIIKITDENGEVVPVTLNKEAFAQIDFDTDLTIVMETNTNNKDVQRQQSIALYDKVKDDPIVDRASLLKDLVFRDGFDVKNTDRYIKPSGLKPGVQLSGSDGQTYVVDDSGSVVPQQDMNETAQSSGDIEPASDQAAVQSSPYSQAQGTS